MLGKLWPEALDEVPSEPLEVLEAAGATPAIRTLWAAWPQARALVASDGLLRWELDLRVSALVGFLGDGGLELDLDSAIQLGFDEQVSTRVLLIFALVVASDASSDALRHAGLRGRRRGARPSVRWPRWSPWRPGESWPEPAGQGSRVLASATVAFT